MRAIDADELKKCVLKWLPEDPCGRQEKEMPFETDICVSMLMEIEEQPTIQPEQRTGKWIVPSQVPDMVRGYWAKCSACGRSTFGGGKFCRECGANMEGDAE